MLLTTLKALAQVLELPAPDGESTNLTATVNSQSPLKQLQQMLSSSMRR